MSAGPEQKDVNSQTTDTQSQHPPHTRQAYLEELRHLIGSGQYDIPATVIAECMIEHFEQPLGLPTR